ncbi:protocadherin gamma-A5-like [Salarias fasciatus]|uniref:protocadherin gamma-A5-like n=1 Tax=Salarias fasciatus TaxID=181472 RepID=UPI001176D1F2|nr:protocadherin gamma-A5-like [Salarias fasciatus]
MGVEGQRRGVDCWWIAVILSLCFVERICAQLRYSVPEEVQVGSTIGNVAKDLSLDISTLRSRRFRIVSGPNHALFHLNQNNGVLYVGQIMDRETLCDGTKVCLMNLKIVVENPLEIHYIGVEITDVNDHAPTFPESEQRLEIGENTPLGTRFQIHAARDPDFGTQSVRLYKLTSNDIFDIEVRDSEEDKVPFIVLKKSLDREKKAEHRLSLTATDGGNPSKSGSLNLTITVIDANDNRPVFSKDVYTVSLDENAPTGTTVIQLNATDLDEGLNGEIEYSFGKTQKKKVQDTFELDSVTGEIRVKGMVDFEDTELYRLDLQASDKGQPPWAAENSGTPPLSNNVTVNVFILDQNDNAPVILYPLSSNGSAEGVQEIPRNVNAGHLVTKVRAYDADIGYNGWLLFSLQEVTDHSLFGLDRYTGQIRTLRSFTETDEAEHKLVILVKDNGNVSLSATATVIVKLVEPKEAFAASDVKSAAKVEEEDNVTFYLMITLGAVSILFLFSIIVLIAMQCSKSTDYTSKYLQETNYDGTLCHSIQYRSGDKRYMLVGPRMSIGSTIVPGSHANTLVLPDRRRPSEEFQFQVVATDSGTPPLSNNVTVNVFILDQNDNAPVILYPLSSNGSAEGVEEIPRNVNAGHLVTKVRAYDADIGYNGWLLFSLQEVTDHSLFGLDRYTGQIRTLRSFTETDEAEHKLVILVKDNGNVSLSATATVIVKLVEPKEAFAASDVKSAAKVEEEDNVTFYLTITLGAVSLLFIISIIVLIAMQCSKSTDYTSKYLQETNYDGTLCHSIQYRSGDKRYMLVGPRMSVGSTIVPGSHANTLVLPDRRRASEENWLCPFYGEYVQGDGKDAVHDQKHEQKEPMPGFAQGMSDEEYSSNLYASAYDNLGQNT